MTAPILYLVGVSFESVEFVAALPDGKLRPVRVQVGSGSSWLDAVCFPTDASDAGESLGDDAQDHEVRRRAAEELARLAGARDTFRIAS